MFPRTAGEGTHLEREQVGWGDGGSFQEGFHLVLERPLPKAQFSKLRPTDRKPGAPASATARGGRA